jgi:hypothetical protein
MAIERVKDFFVSKYAIPYNKKTLKPFGLFRAIREFNFDRSVEVVLNEGGHFSGALGAEMGQPQNSIAGSFSEVPDFTFVLMEDASVTEFTDPLGSVGAIQNKSGTSVSDATTGIASVTAKTGEEQNIKGIRYVFVATGPNTIDIYVHGDAKFLSVSGVVVENVVVPDTGGTLDIDELGIVVTGGSGTIAFVTDETAFVDTRPINDGFSIVKVGSESAVANEFGMTLVRPKQSTGLQFWSDIHSVMAQGLPWQGVSRDWSVWELAGTPIYDQVEDALYTNYSKNFDFC